MFAAVPLIWVVDVVERTGASSEFATITASVTAATSASSAPIQTGRMMRVFGFSVPTPMLISAPFVPVARSGGSRSP